MIWSIMILYGLRLDFRLFVLAIEARSAPLAFDDLYALLLSEDSQFKFDTQTTILVVSAHIATKNYATLNNSTGCGCGCDK